MIHYFVLLITDNIDFVPNQESRLPSGSDQGFCNKLYSTFGTPAYQSYFKKPRFSNNAFTVVHYAHDVQYEAEGFMDKNKDTVPEEHLTLLQNSEFDFLATMIQQANSSPNGSPSPSNSLVCYYILILLMSLIHAIMCLQTDNNRKASSTAKKPTLGSMFKVCGLIENNTSLYTDSCM